MSADDTATYTDFLTHYTPLLNDLASNGWTATESYHRFALLHPNANREHLARAIYSDTWTFASTRDHTLSSVLMASALWYAVAHSYDLKPNHSYAAAKLDPVIIQDLPRMLETFDVASEDTANIVGKIGAALEYLADQPYTALDEADYDDLLAHLPGEVTGLNRDDFSWPPPREIIEDRLGDRSWSDALLKVGICPPDHAETDINLDPTSLSERAFRNALGEFLSYCIRYDRKPSVLLYGSWALTHRTATGRAPYLGLIRAKYGSWFNGLKAGRRMINDALHLHETSALPASTGEHPTAPLDIDSITAQGIGIVQTGSAGEQVDPWETLHHTMIQRLDELPWSRSLRLYYITPLAVETGDYTNYVRVLRSPAGYFCELTSPTEFTSVPLDLDTDLLSAQGWAPPASGGRWTKNFLSVPEAATGILTAMREGMGCTQPDYYQSEDLTAPFAGDAANPSTGAVPMITVADRATTSIEDFD